jgi:GNAT superfamily N-acetyltransferase
MSSSFPLLEVAHAIAQSSAVTRLRRVDIRRVSDDEIDVCLDIFLQASNDLEKKRGQPAIPPEEVAWMPESIAHLLTTDPDRVVFAVKDDQPVGLGAAFQRDDFWFLSYLEVVPEHQGAGVGRTLLEFLLPSEQERASMTLATVVEAAQPVSTMLYAQYGIVPRVPLYWLEKLRTIEGLPPLPSGVVGRPLSVDVHQQAIDVLDRELLGYARPQDHAMWARSADRASIYVREDGALGGYAYLMEDAWIGPGLGTDEDLVGAIIRDLLEGYTGPLGDVTIPLAGNAAHLLPALLRAGVRSDEGAKLLYCSNGLALPPQYLFYGGFLP